MLTIHPELKKAIKNNTLVVFAGAGTSSKLGLPDWDHLVHEMLDKIDDKQSDKTFSHFKVLIEKKVLTALQVLNILEQDYKDVVWDVITDKLRLKNDTDLDFHKKIIQLTSKIITTNYDKCFEGAWGLSARVIHNDDDYSLWKLKDYKEYIYKLHGDIDRAQSCILFESQYKELYAKEEFWIGFMNLLMNSTFLFIGFSLTDDYVNSILKKIKDLHKGLTNKHFIITTHADKLYQELKDHVIPIPIERYDQLSIVLDELMLPTTKNLPARPNNKFIGRIKELRDIIKHLKEDALPVVIKGEAGVGKTRLAIETGYACLNQSSVECLQRVSFVNVIWISSADFKNDANYLNSIFNIIGRELSLERITKISENENWKKEWEVYKFLQENKTLLIIDNFESIEKPNELLQWIQRISENTKVVLVTAALFENIQSFTVIDLHGLNEEESIQLVREEAGSNNVLQQQLIDNPGLNGLFAYTKGNPRTLQLAAGQLKQGLINFDQIKKQNNQSVLEELHNKIWSQLSADSKKFLSLFSVFSNVRNIDEAALRAACEKLNIDFDNASQECDSLNIYIVNEEARYTIPLQTHAFLKQKSEPAVEEEVKNTWIQYFHQLVIKNVKRDEINVPYWNSLVSDKMKALKKDWNAINEVLNWLAADEKYDRLFVEMVTWLIHYMDSRFYNQDRLNFVNAAIQATQRLELIYEESLFRIDALGWTYIEESSFDKAEKEISAGIRLAEELEKKDDPKANSLLALGYAWLAKAQTEKDNLDDAFKSIKKALSYTMVEPWIRYRVFMASGDVFVHEKKFNKALESYEKAKAQYDTYEGEGQDYQINPRIGLAYLSNNKIELAKGILEKQINEDIPIGNLYAEYGLALIDYYESREKDKTLTKLDEIEKEICKRTSSNVLLKLIKTFKEKELH